MLSYQTIVDAVNTINGHRGGFASGPVLTQVILSLKFYKDRGEFDGSIASAYACLELAGYDLDKPQKQKHFLSGDHDEDYFLTSSDMSSFHWDMLLSCYHQGACDDDTLEAARYFEITDEEKAREYLLAAGIEPEKLEDSTSLAQFYLWVLSGDIQDRERSGE